MSFMLFHHPEHADEYEQYDRNHNRDNDVISCALFHVEDIISESVSST